MIALVASVSAGQSTPTTAAIDTTGANLLVVSTSCWGPSGAITLVDSKGNTWTGLTSYGGPSGSARQQFFYRLSPIVGPGHTFTTNAAVVVYAFSGVGGYQTQSGAGSFVGSPKPVLSGSVTPGASGALVLTGMASTDVGTDSLTPAGFTLTAVPFVDAVTMQETAAYYIQPTAAPINPTWNWTGTHNHAGVATAVFTPQELLVSVAESVRTGEEHSMPVFSLGMGRVESLAVADVATAGFPLYVVQTTNRGDTSGGVYHTIGFSAAPKRGNAIVVTVVQQSNNPIKLVDDARGNGYRLAASVRQGTGSSSPWAYVYYCPEVVNTSVDDFDPFIIRIDGSSNFSSAAVEIGGMRGGVLAVEAVKTNTGTTGPPTTGPTAALTVPSVLLAAVESVGTPQTSMTVESATPPWVEVFEQPNNFYAVGEGDTRALTGALGQTPSASWTNSTLAVWSAVIVAFKVVQPPFSTGPLTRVQGTGTVSANNIATFSLTLPTPPALGNAVVLLLGTGDVFNGHFDPSGVRSATDNWGNSYAVADWEWTSDAPPSVNRVALVSYCRRVAATGAPFTVTVATNNVAVNWKGSLTEVSGGLGGLRVNRSATFALETGSPGPVTTSVGPLLPLTVRDVFLAAALSVEISDSYYFTAVDVESTEPPPWAVEWAWDGASAGARGEGNSRSITDVLGETPSVEWTLNSEALINSYERAAVLVAFASSGLSVTVAEHVRGSDRSSRPVTFFGIVPLEDVGVQDVAVSVPAYVPAVWPGSQVSIKMFDDDFQEWTVSTHSVPLWVHLIWDTAVGGGTPTPVAVSFDGVPLTLLSDRTPGAPVNPIYRAGIWCLPTPGTKTAALRITPDLGGIPPDTVDLTGVAVSIQYGFSLREHALIYHEVNTLTPTHTIQNQPGDLVFDLVAGVEAYETFTVGPQQTLLTAQSLTVGSQWGSASSVESGSAPTAMSWTLTRSQHPMHSVAVISRTGLLPVAETIQVREQAHPAAPAREHVGAYLFNADLEGLTRTTGVTAGSSDYTVAGWVLPTIIGVVNYRVLFAQIEDAAGTYIAWAGVWNLYDDGQDYIVLDVGDGGTSFGTVRAVMSPGRPYRWAYVRQGTAHRLYLDGVLVGTITADLSAAGFDGLYVGSDGRSGSSGFSIAYLREWSSALTLDALLPEWNREAALVTTGLVSDAPLQSHLNDQSGSANHWTPVGAVYPVPIGPLIGNITSQYAGSVAELAFTHRSGGGSLGIAVTLLGATRTVAQLYYGAQRLTRLHRLTSSSYAMEWWALSEVPVGTATVFIMPDAACDFACAVYDLPRTLARAAATVGATSAAPSISLSSAQIGELVLDMVAVDNASQVFTVGPGQAPLFAHVSTAPHVRLASSVEPVKQRALTWTLSVSDAWALSGFSIPPSGTTVPVATVTTLGKTAGTATSLTVSHASDGNPLYVHVAFGAAARTATTVTFNGVGLTRLWRGTTGTWAHEVWYLAAPTAITANVVITADATNQHAAAVHNVSGGLQGWQGTITGATGTAVAHAVTSTLRDLVLDLLSSDASNQTFTAGTGQTRIAQQSGEVNTHVKVAAGSAASQFLMPAGAVTMSWGVTFDVWATAAFALQSTLFVIASETVTLLDVATLRAGTIQLRVAEVVRASEGFQPPLWRGYLKPWEHGLPYDALFDDMERIGESTYWWEGVPYGALPVSPLHLELPFVAEVIRTRDGAAPMTAEGSELIVSGQAGEDTVVLDVVRAVVPRQTVRPVETVSAVDSVVAKRRYATTGVRFGDASWLIGDVLPTPGPRTFAIWAYPDIPTTDSFGCLFNIGVTDGSIYVQTNGLSGLVTFRWNPAGSALVYSAEYPPDAWYFVAVVMDPVLLTHNLYIYSEEFQLLEMLPGVPYLPASQSPKLVVGSTGVFVGTDFKGNAAVGNLLIYAAALEPEELAVLSTNYIPDDMTGLWGWYRLTSHTALANEATGAPDLASAGTLTTTAVGEGPQIPTTGGIVPSLNRSVEDDIGVTELVNWFTSPMTVQESESIVTQESQIGSAALPGHEPFFVDLNERITTREARTSALGGKVFLKVWDIIKVRESAIRNFRPPTRHDGVDFLRVRDVAKAQMYIGGGIYARVGEDITAVQNKMYLGYPAKTPPPSGIPDIDVIGVGPNPGYPPEGLGLDYWIAGVDVPTSLKKET